MTKLNTFDKALMVRISSETLIKFSKLAEAYNTTKSKFLRELIEITLKQSELEKLNKEN